MNVKDIVLVRSSEMKDSNIAQIRPQDVSFASEIRFLSLFLRFKLKVVEGRKDALGKSVVSALNVKEPSMAAPHRAGEERYLFIPPCRCHLSVSV